jgi:hypothetical protein
MTDLSQEKYRGFDRQAQWGERLLDPAKILGFLALASILPQSVTTGPDYSIVGMKFVQKRVRSGFQRCLEIAGVLPTFSFPVEANSSSRCLSLGPTRSVVSVSRFGFAERPRLHRGGSLSLVRVGMRKSGKRQLKASSSGVAAIFLRRAADGSLSCSCGAGLLRRTERQPTQVE